MSPSRRTRALLGAAFGLWVACIPARAEIPLDWVVAAQCDAPRGSVALEFGLPIPDAIYFLTRGNRRALPRTAVINGNVSAAVKETELSVDAPPVVLVTGLVRDQVRSRLLMDEARFCAASDSIEVNYLFAGTEPTTVRLRLKAGKATAVEVTPAGRAEILRRVAARHGDTFASLFGPDQAWFAEYETALSNRDARDRFARKYCGGCNWTSQQRLAVALTLLMESLSLDLLTDSADKLLAMPGVEVAFLRSPASPPAPRVLINEDALRHAFGRSLPRRQPQPSPFPAMDTPVKVDRIALNFNVQGNTYVMFLASQDASSANRVSILEVVNQGKVMYP